ncbi:MAG: nucleotide exchange factor GrpE [Bacteroidetes bacterium HGW-Bacteroidetes-9]|jgi:molecular chaperone GrpE|nr:MAG: nucleotide exchange factor GrpE [Bacteroidetes bacterium HGW-Bacteroidetes-9]
MKIFDNMGKPRKSKPEVKETLDNVATPETIHADTDTAAEAENNKPAIEEEAKPEDIIAELNKKCQDLNDKFLRLYSEFDNYRKRVIKEKAELSKNASEDMITGLLPILDDFERAISSYDTVDTVEPLKEGTLLIYNKLKNSLKQKGVVETEALGLPFNTDFHEAIANVPAPTEELKNKIIDVTQKGYTLNGKVIRFAKVVVGN